MSHLFPKYTPSDDEEESINMKIETKESQENSEGAETTAEVKENDKKEGNEKEEPKKEDLDKPFVDEETDVEIKPKPKKKRQLSEKQLKALAAAREKSKIKRMKLAEARRAETEAKKDEKKKKAEEKRKKAAEKKAAELAEIDAFQIVKEKQYSFTKDELNSLLDNTIDRHETARKKRKEEEKRRQQPNVAQAYPYALPHVAVPQPYPIHMHPAQPPPLQKPEKPKLTLKEQMRLERDEREAAKAQKFLNNYFNIN